MNDIDKQRKGENSAGGYFSSKDPVAGDCGRAWVELVTSLNLSSFRAGHMLCSPVRSIRGINQDRGGDVV